MKKVVIFDVHVNMENSDIVYINFDHNKKLYGDLKNYSDRLKESFIYPKMNYGSDLGCRHTTTLFNGGYYH